MGTLHQYFYWFLSVALAIGFGLGKRVNDFLNETRRGTVDEKIAMLYGYTNDVKAWDASDTNTRFKVERIKSDLRSIGRMKKAIQQGQKEDLISAKDQLIQEMKRNKEISWETRLMILIGFLPVGSNNI